MSNGKRVYFLRDYDPLQDFSDGEIISLAPATSYELKKREIPYSILPSFCSEAELRKGEEDIFFQELAWTERFDQFLQKNIPLLAEHNIRPAYHHFSKLKYLLDTWMIFCIRVDHFLRKCRPGEIVYVYRRHEKTGEFSFFNLRKNVTDSFPRLLTLLCKKNSIHFTRLELEPDPGPVPVKKSRWGEITRQWVASTPVKSLYNIYRYKKYRRLYPGYSSSRCRVLLLDAGGYAIDHVISEFLAQGCRVFVKLRHKILDYSFWFDREAADCHDAIEQQTPFLQPELARVKELLKSQEWLWDMVREKTSYDLAEVLIPYFQHFIDHQVSQMAAEYLALSSFSEKEKIDLMVARGSSGSNYPAALNLAQNSSRIKSACFQHGCGPVRMLDWIHGELDYFDYFFATDDISKRAFKELSQAQWLKPCEVLESGHYLRRLGKKKEPVQKSLLPTILYVPNKSYIGTRKFNTFLYSPTWLYEFQRQVIDLFGSRKNIQLIYKHHPSTDWAPDSTLKYIEEKQYGNVKVETGKLEDYLGIADRFITDFPSTPLFEAAAAGLPVIALYPSVLTLLPAMSEFFGPSLCAFSSAEEALGFVQEFLDSPREKYIRKLTYSEEDSLEHFLQQLTRQEKSRVETAEYAPGVRS